MAPAAAKALLGNSGKARRPNYPSLRIASFGQWRQQAYLRKEWVFILIVPFSLDHIPQAQALLQADYRRAQQQIPSLLPASPLPSLLPYVQNGLGMAALEGQRLLGFLCCNPPRQRTFGSQVSGVFSPIHAHAVQPQDRGPIFQRLYQAAAERWAAAGALYHSIALWTWDTQGIQAFFRYGFGMRCTDALQELDVFPPPQIPPGLNFRQLKAEESPLLDPLRQLLREHLRQSPCFMNPAPDSSEELASRRLFAAFDSQTPIAFLETADTAETFLAESADIQNICGAFCLPRYRGGLYRQLLYYVAGELARQGFRRLGVDYESFNPTAVGFWEKHFAPYTRGLVRLIG